MNTPPILVIGSTGKTGKRGSAKPTDIARQLATAPDIAHTLLTR